MGDLHRIRRAKNKEAAALILAAIRNGHDYKMTKAGVMLYGPHGRAATHLDGSDKRAARNFRAELKRAGITTDR